MEKLCSVFGQHFPGPGSSCRQTGYRLNTVQVSNRTPETAAQCSPAGDNLGAPCGSCAVLGAEGCHLLSIMSLESRITERWVSYMSSAAKSSNQLLTASEIFCSGRLWVDNGHEPAAPTIHLCPPLRCFVHYGLILLWHLRRLRRSRVGRTLHSYHKFLTKYHHSKHNPLKTK